MSKRKTYNPFKMWGFWVGLITGGLTVFISFVFMYGNNPIQFVYLINPFYLLNNLYLDSLPWSSAIKAAIPGILGVFLTTPIVFALYGWGIHSLFRKISS